MGGALAFLDRGKFGFYITVGLEGARRTSRPTSLSVFQKSFRSPVLFPNNPMWPIRSQHVPSICLVYSIADLLRGRYAIPGASMVYCEGWSLDLVL